MVGRRGLKAVGGAGAVRRYIIDQKLFNRDKDTIKGILEHFDLDPALKGKIDGYISQFNRWIRAGRKIELIRNMPRRGCGRPKPESQGLLGAHYINENYDYTEGEDIIGEGAFGIVYKATKKTEPNQGKIFALKSCRDLGDVQIEQSIANALEHNSQYLSLMYCSTNVFDGFVLVHEYHPGGSLYDKVQDMDIGEEFSMRQMQVIMAELIVGLKKLHEAGFVHRDIKPPNIMIDALGHVTIIDFGLAIRSFQMNSYERSGTLPYFSPEVIGQDSLVPDGCQPAQDWYALGVVFYELMEAIHLFVFPGVSDDTAMEYMINMNIPKLDDKLADRVFKGLLSRGVEDRMHFVAEIEKEPFFEGIDWDQVRQGTIEPPFMA